MENRLRCGLQRGIAEEGTPGVQIAVEAREVGAGDVNTQTVPRLQHHARGPEIERILIDHARGDGAGIGPRLTPSTSCFLLSTMYRITAPEQPVQFPHRLLHAASA
jgi:hypothetical protein